MRPPTNLKPGVMRSHERCWQAQGFIWAVAAALAGCVSAPRIEPAKDRISTGVPTIVDAEGRPFSPDASRALLRKAGIVGADAVLMGLARVSEEITHEPLVAGNDVRPLVDGPATFDAMIGAISTARHHVHLETFIFDDDEVGNQIASVLIERRRAGVEVRIIYDAIGSRNMSEEFAARLRDAGIALFKYRPLDPMEDLRLWRLNVRDHRKLLIVDGKVAFMGGINISEVYAESSLSIAGKGEAHNTTDRGWRDTQAMITGPAVHRFQKIFVALWKEHEPGARFDTADYYPPTAPQGDILVRAVSSRGGDEEYRIYTVLLAAVAHARSRIWITQAYFAPDDVFLEVLRDAARRGVDVRLLLPGISDAPLVVQASRADYESLLEAGVRIYEHVGSTLHAKTAVVDGVWSTIGSANLDYRSFLHNHELNAVIIDRDFGRAMEKLFEVDLQRSREILLEAWRGRPVMQRVKETLGNLLRYWF